ncbi:hexitol phosphatase HxpB [Cytophagaceae bacterium ABcell3]|nr:hexitol phosphatase HxpB [Cytophagaceae bacterium ABcell3]
MIKAVIFDMDGLLIDSEPFWRKAEKIVFREVGIELTDEHCESTMGLRIDEVVKHWYRKKPWENKSLLEIENAVVDHVEELIRTTGQPMPGVYDTISMLKSKGIDLAIASSSSFRLIHAVTEKLGIKDDMKLVHSAEKEEFGKPHPSIYIYTGRELGREFHECLVFEDSFNGLIAAKAARMHAIAIPDSKSFSQTRFDIADFKLSSLKDFNERHLEFFTAS